MANTPITSRSATAAYIEEILIELRLLSIEINGEFLAYLLEMALVEASDLASLEKDAESFALEQMSQNSDSAA